MEEDTRLRSEVAVAASGKRQKARGHSTASHRVVRRSGLTTPALCAPLFSNARGAALRAEVMQTGTSGRSTLWSQEQGQDPRDVRSPAVCVVPLW
jgi:hypothetical protein